MDTRRRCFCISQGCAKHPQQFRLLSATKYREHQKTEAASLDVAVHLKSNVDLLLGSIEGAFAQYKTTDFQLSLATFQIKADSTQPLTSARAILIAHDSVNRELLSYEEWHEESVKLLKNISQTAFNSAQAISLVKDLSVLYMMILSSIKVELESRLQSASEAQAHSKHAARLLESRIVRSIKEQQFIRSFPSQADNDSSPIGRHPSPHHRNPSEQLRRIDEMITELNICDEISPLHKEELLKGLEEHRQNVKADSDRQIFQRRYPHLPVRAIIKSMLVKSSPE